MTGQWADLIESANNTAAFLKSLPDGTRTKLIEAFKILASGTLESAEKLAKIDELIKGVQDEEIKAFLHSAAESSVKVSEWMKERLQQEEPTVREACRNMVRLLVSHDFVVAPDAEKEQQLNTLVAGFNETQLAAFKKFKADADAFLHSAAESSVKVSEWMKERLQQEEPTVREACRNMVRLLVSHDFVVAPDAEKEQQLNTLVAGFNETQLAAFKKFKADADARDKE